MHIIIAVHWVIGALVKSGQDVRAAQSGGGLERVPLFVHGPAWRQIADYAVLRIIYHNRRGLELRRVRMSCETRTVRRIGVPVPIAKWIIPEAWKAQQPPATLDISPKRRTLSICEHIATDVIPDNRIEPL